MIFILAQSIFLKASFHYILGYKYLSLSEQGYAEEVTGKVTISLMSVMRIKYKLSPGAIEISEVLLQEPSDSESCEEEENMYDLRNESEAEKSYDIPIQSKIEVFSNIHIGKTDLKKKNTNHSYNPNQIGRFLLLVTEQFPVKTAATGAGINLSSAY